MADHSNSTERAHFADPLTMQRRLFSQLSAMFGRETPLYDKSLLVNQACNRSVCALLLQAHRGFSITDEQLEKTSGERHGAIRIGTPEEYRWVAGFFAAFALLPHGFYDMTSLGGKSQPIIATAFRSVSNPEHRVFCSLLMIDSFDPEIRRRIETLLSKRHVFSERAKELVLKNAEQGGLTEADADELIREGTTRIFKWTGRAHDYHLYKELCDSGFKIAADIACFESHHLNHLTPNTLWIDLYTSGMKFCLGEIDSNTFRARATAAMEGLRAAADADFMKLHFRHLSADEIDTYAPADISADQIAALVDVLTDRLTAPELDLSGLKHSGFKEFTEGPPAGIPILLRQDSYKALTEPVKFVETDGTTVDAVHTARFGEIEQRFYATSAAGRAMYDRCLLAADAARDKDPGLIKRDYNEYERTYAAAFAEIPRTLPELMDSDLVYARYYATEKGIAAVGRIDTTDIRELLRLGLLRCEGLRYEDFLPFSAAGIFASNLGQYGTRTAVEKPVYTQRMLEEIMGRPIIDPSVTYAGEQAESLLKSYNQLDLLKNLPAADVAALESAVTAALRMVHCSRCPGGRRE